MGLFFERKAPSSDLVNLFDTALRTPPPPDGSSPQKAADLVSSLRPLTQTIQAAVDAPPPADPVGAAKTAAQATVDQLLGGASFNTGRFVIAFLIFAALVGGGIACEATHLTTATGTLFGFAGAIFGIVTAFLGAEKSGG